MLDVLTEDMIDLRTAAKLAPFARSDGRPAHIASMYRFAQRGARSVSGERFRLETVKTPRGLLTSRQAIQRFIAALTYGSGDVAPATSRDHDRAEAYCAAAGI